MRFGRKRGDGFDAPITAVDRVVRRTSVGLAVVTLVLIGALLAGVGVVTAAVALRASSDQVDRTLKQAADSRIQQLQLQAEQVELPTPTPSASPTSTSSDDDEPTARPTPSPTRTRTPRPTQTARQTVRPTRTRTPEATRTNDNSGPGNGDGTPRPARTDNSGSLSRDAAIGAFAQLRLFPTPAPASTTTARPTPSASFALPGLGDRPPESADTFFLLLNTAGDVISNPQGVSLDGLPDEAAVVTAIITGEDWRTTTVRGVRVRLLTQPVRDPDGNPVGVLQSGFVLTLQDQQTNQLLTTIALACLVGLTGAALITLFITRRAMRPIRSAFDAERRFVASASHELRTPAAVVRANAEILEREDLVKPEGK
ncbi:MAG TPA: histidine kinase dimerization/phospho-acceptor domain-containing protein, partial [Candidatus Limnocylindrales bacterium]|nr:histidine kinase dimerization/phospho-acceptor domain-containing protein [Candidatus Limnocylindrales bacterium]